METIENENTKENESTNKSTQKNRCIVDVEFKHLKIEKDADNILWVYFDKALSPVNTLNSEVFDELEVVLKKIEAEHAAPHSVKIEQFKLQGVVFASKKKNCFIAGADIEQFTHLKTVEEAHEFIRRGQIVFDRMKVLPVPTVAMIEGVCLGGGLEFALACTYRVAEESDKKILGLPEVLLGIHPGWGGSIRLPKLIGAPKAMDLILTGRSVTAKSAKRMGFVDAAVPKRHLKRAAIYYIQKRPTPHKASFIEALTNTPVIRPLLAKILKKQVSKKANKQHYPSPYAIINNWQQHGVDNPKAYLGEARSLAKLVLNDTARNLVRLFFLQERMKGLAKQSAGQSTHPKIEHLHVIGAGIMGGGIAMWCALKGIKVTLQDQNKEAIAGTLKEAYKLFKKKLKKPRLIQAAMDRLHPDPEGEGISRADLVIEAVFENLEVKQKLLKAVEGKIKKNAILATNTSSILLDEINTVLKNPERLVGIHFFNPVAKMLLVEVVHGKVTDKEIQARALAFVKQIGRFPVPVKSSPGFLVNRILMPYLMECMMLLGEGIPAPVIDRAAKAFGMPMGPIELADTVGLDICLSVAENLIHHYGGEISQPLRDKVAAGELGRKTGKGFYSYKKGKPVKISPSNAKASSKDAGVSDDLTNRLILRLINESMACLREDVIPDGDLLDAAMVFGTGFAPFRGGPLHYAEACGFAEINQKLEAFAIKYGERFQPDVSFSAQLKKEEEVLA